MTSWHPVTPEWVRAPAQLGDLHVLAFREYKDTGSAWHEAAGAAASWIRGGRSAPITFREDSPITLALAKAELFAAVTVDSEGMPPPPLEDICGRLGVAYRAPVATNPVWARGVEDVLRWLTADPIEQRKPPMDVPVRGADGAVPTAEQLYQQRLAEVPGRYRASEQRRDVRQAVEVDVIRSQRLADRIAETLRSSRQRSA